MSNLADWREWGALERAGLVICSLLAGVLLLGMFSARAHAAEPIGIYVGGEASEEEAKQPKFKAESYPVALTGTGETNHVFTTKLGSWKCAVAEFAGKQPAATAAQWLWMSYFQCIPPFGTASIFTNGCEYILHVANSGPPYTGQLQLACPAGKAYELIFTSGGTSCTIAFSPQTSSGGVSYANKGAGSNRAITVTFNVTGLKYVLKGPPLICKAGSYEDGTYTGTMTLHGATE
ncbi:MAG: hypothetical protein WA687_13915 [Solirubrobacterales bacterium]